ncbi:hypothetical protein [Ureibacillus xyleni]|nr:hypothetical protein [Ureibacillus xyleni]
MNCLNGLKSQNQQYVGFGSFLLSENVGFGIDEDRFKLEET